MPRAFYVHRLLSTNKTIFYQIRLLGNYEYMVSLTIVNKYNEKYTIQTLIGVIVAHDYCECQKYGKYANVLLNYENSETNGLNDAESIVN